MHGNVSGAGEMYDRYPEQKLNEVNKQRSDTYKLNSESREIVKILRRQIVAANA